MLLNLIRTIYPLLFLSFLCFPCFGQQDFYDTENERIKGRKTDSISKYSTIYQRFFPNDNAQNTSDFSPSINLYNVKDLLLFGVAHKIKKPDSIKQEYAFEQNISALIAPKTGAFELKYYSTFYSLFGKNLDLVLTGRYIGPAYSFNYFGIGNNTANTEEPDYYRIRSKTSFFDVYTQYRFTDKIKAGIGPGIEYVNILSHNQATFLNDIALGNASYDWFLKASSYLDVDYRDNIQMPQNGWRWTNSVTYNHQTTNNKFKHLKLHTDFSSYYTPASGFPITLALRVGASTNFGDYNFFHANTLGNFDNLRGFRAQRFSGKSAAYGNAEVRMPITKIKSYLIAGDVGVYGFYDIGRVNLTESNYWHTGYGPGIWINLFDKLLLSLGSGFSKEGLVFSFDTGFRF